MRHGPGSESRSDPESRPDPPLRAGGAFYRAHGLGNDYLVFRGVQGDEAGWEVIAPAVRRVCDRHEGVGSDGIVVLLDAHPTSGVYPLRMFNPDGSEFERSGNGLRVLASYLHLKGLVKGDSFRVTTGGSSIRMQVHDVDPTGVHDVSVAMGVAQTGPAAVGLATDALDGDGRIDRPGRGPIPFVPVSVGNPHAVVFADTLEAPDIDELGPLLSSHPAFAEGTNVQLVRVDAPGRIGIEIWERGVGRTSASGTSSCAAAVAAVSTGRLEPGRIEVRMEGGSLEVRVGPDLDVVLRGPVAEIAEGRLTAGFLASLS